MGQVQVPGLHRFPNDDGFQFNHVWGQTLRDGDCNVIDIIRYNPNTTICPTGGIERYVEITRQLNIDLIHAWLFILSYYIKERSY